MSKTARCKTCHHPERARIEMQIANGVAIPRVTRQFSGGGLTRKNVWYHWKMHVSQARKDTLRVVGLSDIKVDLDALKRVEGGSLLQNWIAERARLQRIADVCEEKGLFTEAIRASTAIVRGLELIAKYLGELQTGSTTINQNFLVSPDWVNLRSSIAAALRPYPEAQRAVLAALRARESAAGVDITHARAIERPALEHVESDHA